MKRADLRHPWFAVLALLLAAGCGIQPAPEIRKHDGAEVGPDEPNLGIGSPWTGWDDAREPLVSFDFISGWHADPDVTAGCTNRIERASEPFTASHPALRLVSSSSQAVARVRLVPPAPVAVPEPFDTVELRLGCPAAGAAPAGIPAAASATVCFEDAAGQPLRVGVGAFERGRWTIGRARLARDFVRTAAFPCRLVAIEVTAWARPHADELYVRNLACYTESREPIVPAWRGGRWMQTFVNPARRVLHGDASDPFGPAATRWPLTATNPPPARVEPDVWEFALGGGGTTETYRADLRDGGLKVEYRRAGRIAAAWGGFERMPPVPAGAREVERTEPGMLTVAWAGGDTLRLEVRGCAMLAGFTRAARDATALAARRIEAPGAAALSFAMLSGPVVLGWRPGDPGAAGLFACGYFDPWCSSAARIEILPPGGGQENTARAVYAADDVGRVAPLRETFVFACSARVEEVLPRLPVRAVAPPPGAATRVWRTPSDPAAPVPWPRGLPAPVVFDPAGPGAPVPLPEGDLLVPTHPLWSRDAVRHDPSGNWMRGTGATTRIKIPFVRLWAEACTSSAPATAAARRIGLTGRPPWDMVDHDARTPGAGTFAAPLRALHATLAAVSAAGGPAVADEAWGWLYAAGAGACAGGPLLAADWDRPAWFPLFALLRMREACPLVAPPFAPRAASGADAPHRYLAACFAHGATPLLSGGSGTDAALTTRMAALAQAWIERSGTAAVTRIAFDDGAALRTPAEALAGGSWQRGRLYVAFEGGLELWVNAATGSPWSVRQGGSVRQVPPGGWLGTAAGRPVACSMIEDGRRMDHARGWRFVYHDGGGSEALFDGVGCAKPLLLARAGGPAGGDSCEARFPEGAAAVVLASEAGWRPGRPSSAHAFGADGADLGPVPFEARDGASRLVPPAGAAVCRIEWTE